MKRTVTMTAAAFLLAGLVSPVLALDEAKPADKKAEAVQSGDKKHDTKTAETQPTEAKSTEANPAATTPSQPSMTDEVTEKATDMAKDKATDVGKDKATDVVMDAAKPSGSSAPSMLGSNPASAVKPLTNPVSGMPK